MIPRAYITEWRSHAPWSQDAWVEQDLVISRALVGIFGAAGVAERLAFRGGTALYKLYFEKGVVEQGALLACFQRYMTEDGQAVSRAQFEANLHEKCNSPAFSADIEPLLRPGLTWDFNGAMDTVLEQLVARLPGAPWKGQAE